MASLKFWLSLEQEIIKAKQENCCVLLEMDANAKLEVCGLQKLSENGRRLLDMSRRLNLTIVNNAAVCKGQSRGKEI